MGAAPSAVIYTAQQQRQGGRVEAKGGCGALNGGVGTSRSSHPSFDAEQGAVCLFAQLAVACPSDTGVDALVEAVYAPDFETALLKAMAARGFADTAPHLLVLPYSDVDQGLGLSLAPSPAPTPAPVPTVPPAVLAAEQVARAQAERKAEAGGLFDAICYRLEHMGEGHVEAPLRADAAAAQERQQPPPSTSQQQRRLMLLAGGAVALVLACAAAVLRSAEDRRDDAHSRAFAEVRAHLSCSHIAFLFSASSRLCLASLLSFVNSRADCAAVCAGCASHGKSEDARSASAVVVAAPRKVGEGGPQQP